MTIEKGREWGATAPVPADLVLVRSNAELRRLVDGSRRSGTPIPPVGLLGGDLCRTVGGTGDEARLRGEVVLLPVDLGVAVVDGTEHWFAAHAVARRSWWRGPLRAAMNAQFLGSWDVAPRSHPNDGRLDLVEVDPGMTFADRLKARRRLPTGTHVPHPRIHERRVVGGEWRLDAGERLWLDGVEIGPATTVALRVEPDAFVVCV